MFLIAVQRSVASRAAIEFYGPDRAKVRLCRLHRTLPRCHRLRGQCELFWLLLACEWAPDRAMECWPGGLPDLLCRQLPPGFCSH
jgi:hypothetical protein